MIEPEPLPAPGFRATVIGWLGTFWRRLGRFAFLALVVYLLLIASLGRGLSEDLSGPVYLSLVLILFLAVLTVGVGWFAGTFSKRVDNEAQLEQLVRVAYGFTLGALVGSSLLFAVLPMFPVVAEYLETSPVGIVGGCAIPLAGTAGALQGSDCGRGSAQWVVNIGGIVLPADPVFASRKLDEPMAELVSLLNRIALAHASDAQSALSGSLRQKSKQVVDLFPPGQVVEVDKLAAAVREMTAPEPQQTASMTEAASLLAARFYDARSGHRISGGLVVPLYFVTLALMGGAVSMMRRVPEYQRRATGRYREVYPELKKIEPQTARPIDTEEACEFLVFQIMQVFSAPLIAFVAFALVSPVDRASQSAIAFASGFSAETVLLMIRSLTEKLRPAETITATPDASDVAKSIGSASKIVLLVSIAFCTSGCAEWQKRSELEAVARDWCYTIRASQVLPVYPLSEDLQPGDLYLVQLPIDQQQSAYKKRGFLPLDNMIARLPPSGYHEYYKYSFGLGDGVLPKRLVEGDGTGWLAAPTAAFPSYAFAVQSGQGAKVALPVSGVPVGLTLLNSDAASGSITISDVRTYGVDTVSLFEDVRAWGKIHREFLANFSPRSERVFWIFDRTRTNYLRVVARVFATRKVNIELRASGSAGAQVDVGVGKTVELFAAKTDGDPSKAVAENYAANLKAVNSALEGALEAAGTIAPGGSLKLASASSRSVSMVEVFPKPLVIAYLGFDMAILNEGRLGPPIPTFAVLHEEGKAQSDQYATYDTGPDVDCLQAWLDAGEDPGMQETRVKELQLWWTTTKKLEGFASLLIKTKEFSAERAEFMKAKSIACGG